MSNVKLTCPICLAEFNASEQLEEHFKIWKAKRKCLIPKIMKLMV